MFGGGGGDSPFSDFFQTFFGGGGARSSGGGGQRRGRGRGRQQSGHDVEHDSSWTSSRRRAAACTGCSCATTARRAASRCAFPPASPTARWCGWRAKAARGTGGAASGDLFLRIRLRPHPAYQVSGRDLTTRVSVPVTTAVLGGEVSVITLGGKTVRVKIPETTQPGQKLRLRGLGLPALGDKGAAGDLFVIVDVALPRH